MSIRRKALEALMDITDRGAYANLRLKDALLGLPQGDAAWISAAVYTALDHLLYLDYIIGHYAKGRVDSRIRCVLRLGLCQALYMDVPAHTACDESVKLAKEIGKGALSGYVNAVMRAMCKGMAHPPDLPKETADRLSIQYSWPKFLVEDYIRQYGEAFTEQMLRFGAYRGMTLRAASPFTAEDLDAALRERGIPFSRGALAGDAFRLGAGLNIAAEPLFLQGAVTVQSESSMLVCRAIGPKPGMRVLDACAAPGGKTAYLSALLSGSGGITALELHAHRLELLRQTLSRLHVTNAEALQKDASVYLPEFDSAFDAVLVDAPCSGLGVAGKPDARYARSDRIIDDLSKVQSALLDVCARYVAPGGTLLYSTCTISGRENEGVADGFLTSHAEFEACLPKDLTPPALSGRIANGRIQLFPHLDDTEGFFIARFRRIR